MRETDAVLDASRIHIPVSQATVDCGVYLDGGRLPGRIALQQNSDMRKISAWVALAAVPTLVAGLYGMNFDNIPLEHWEWGYPALMTATLCVCLVLYCNFRRNRWL